jgi:hypothetical protein
MGNRTMSASSMPWGAWALQRPSWRNGHCRNSLSRTVQVVVEALMIPLLMVVRHELPEHVQ